MSSATSERSDAARPASSVAIAILKASANLLIVVLLTLLAIASVHGYLSSGSVKAFGILGINTVLLALFLARRPAKAETVSVPLWLMSLSGTALPLLLRPSAASGGAPVCALLQLSGLAMLAAALLSLRRSFAIAPGNRGIRQGGPYRLVRHPVYLAELTVLLGVTLANPTPLNAVIWVVECALQLARARAEERFLFADPVYRAYCAQVRYRLIPRVL